MTESYEDRLRNISRLYADDKDQGRRDTRRLVELVPALEDIKLDLTIKLIRLKEVRDEVRALADEVGLRSKDKLSKSESEFDKTFRILQTRKENVRRAIRDIENQEHVKDGVRIGRSNLEQKD